MAFYSRQDKEIGLKIFYFGAPRAGKSENLRSLYQQTSQQIKSDLFALQQDTRINPIFDFLPLTLKEPSLAGHRINLHLFTLPSMRYRDSFDLLLQGIDGYVCVIDSSLSSLLANIDSQREVTALLEDCGYIPEETPQVYQYNKRDAEDVVPIEILRETCNKHNYPDKEAIAARGIGTLECLNSLTQQVLQKMLN